MARQRLTGVARRLRCDSTKAEKLMWSRLRARQVEGLKFVRQFPIGSYVVDFACRDLRFVIELDGGQHSPEIDAARSDDIKRAGFHIIRFWNNDVTENIDGVLEAILAEVAIIRGT